MNIYIYIYIFIYLLLFVCGGRGKRGRRVGACEVGGEVLGWWDIRTLFAISTYIYMTPA